MTRTFPTSSNHQLLPPYRTHNRHWDPMQLFLRLVVPEEPAVVVVVVAAADRKLADAVQMDVGNVQVAAVAVDALLIGSAQRHHTHCHCCYCCVSMTDASRNNCWSVEVAFVALDNEVVAAGARALLCVE
jgi:hypothetical protein